MAKSQRLCGLADLPRLQAQQRGDPVAFVFEGRRTTFRRARCAIFQFFGMNETTGPEPYCPMVRMRQVGKASLVVLRPGAPDDAHSIIDWAKERIAGYKPPRSVDFVASIPRRPSGKVLRKDLSAPFWSDHQRRVG